MSALTAILSTTREALHLLENYDHPAQPALHQRLQAPAACLTLPIMAPPDFEGMGCTASVAFQLSSYYRSGCSRLAVICQECFSNTMQSLWALQDCENVSAALRRRAVGDFINSAELLRNEMIQRVRSALDHASSSVATSSSSVPFTFPPDVNAILLRAFDRCNIVTKAERRELAQATGLDDRQIATWVSFGSDALISTLCLVAHRISGPELTIDPAFCHAVNAPLVTT